MQLGRYSVSTLRPPPILSITYGEDGRFFTVATESGYEVWRTWPLALMRRRVLPGALSRAVMLPSSPLLVLQGGGAAPLYSPNKAVIYHDKLGVAVAELEFGERIRGITARKGMICIALLRKVIAFEFGVTEKQKSFPSLVKEKGKSKADGNAEEGFYLRKVGEWETVENELGLMAISSGAGSSLLALPGRQAGHVQLVNLSPCPSSQTSSSSSTPALNSFRSPIILAHTHALSTLSCTSTGSHIITTSERGTLLRVWDTSRGRLERELRRGVDRAEMWGVEVEDGGKSRVAGWSDKGTVHVWADGEAQSTKEGSKSTTSSNAASLGQYLSRNLPLPKYFSSTASVAQYHLPRKNPHAFSAALGAAGVNVPSMRADEDVSELSERFVVSWVEVDVPTPGEPRAEDPRRAADGKGGRRSSLPGPSQMGGLAMGSREDRRSFGSFGSGSDNTSRTATPTMTARRSETPIQGTRGGNRASTLSNLSRKHSATLIPVTKDGLSRGDSFTRTQAHVKLKAPLPPSTSTSTSASNSRHRAQSQSQGRTRKEKQLVAITYSGDWYRLKIPDNHASSSPGQDAAEAKDDAASSGGGGGNGGGWGECQLVEYRRLGVGGGGW